MYCVNDSIFYHKSLASLKTSLLYKYISLQHLRFISYLQHCSFAVMSGCWCEYPEERPHFSELCTLMDKHLSMVSDYTELKMVLVEEPEVHEGDQLNSYQ